MELYERTDNAHGKLLLIDIQRVMSIEHQGHGESANHRAGHGNALRLLENHKSSQEFGHGTSLEVTAFPEVRLTSTGWPMEFRLTKSGTQKR